MPKQKKKKATSNDDIILEVFVAQAVSCGLLQQGNEDDDPPRTELIRSMRCFTSLIQQQQLAKSNKKKKNNNNNAENQLFVDDDAADVDALLSIESATTNLRTTTKHFVASQRERCTEISDCSDELTSLCGTTKDYQSLIFHSRSLKMAFRKQMFLHIMHIEKIIKALHDLYITEERSNLLEHCLDLDAVLKDNLAHSHQSQTIFSIVEKWQSGKKKGTTTLKNSSVETLVHGATVKTANNAVTKSLRDASKNVEVLCLKEIPCLKTFQFSILERSVSIHRVLVVGKEGSGKTHICNDIENSATSDGVRVHRLDIFGQTIGAMEDNIISFFRSAYSDNSACILLVDDLDATIATVDGTKSATRDPTNDSRESHASARARTTFLAMMDASAASCHLRNNIALVCTAKVNVNLSLSRFDDVIFLEPPNQDERKLALKGFVGLDENTMESHSDQAHQQIEGHLDELATSTVGLSYAEISQNCRKAIVVADALNVSMDYSALSAGASSRVITLLEAVQNAVQSFAPSSLRSGVVDGYVDMRVLSSDDLLGLAKVRDNPDTCPLYGHTSSLAWKELESQIVIPLCRSKELNLLLFSKENSSVHGDLSGGVILTGAPGTGKSSLARHCATFAASLLPSVKLLEVSCTSMIHKEVGGSEKAIHHLFECARAAAPCVVILDDIATIASLRGRDNTTEGTMDRVLSTLLTELDGVERDLPTSGDSAGIAVIGVTQNVDWVDPALLRPGRLGKIVILDSPDRETRRFIALRELEHPEASSNAAVELSNRIADKSSGMAGAHVIALCNDAKRSCVENFEASSVGCLPSHVDLISLMSSFIDK